MSKSAGTAEVRLYGGPRGSGGPPGKQNGQYRHGESDQGRDCGVAKIQRIAENAPRWPDMKSCRRVRIGGTILRCRLVAQQEGKLRDLWQ